MPKPAPSEDTMPALPGLRGGGVIGEGGFARVYRARRADHDLEVAVKIALRREDPRFAREAAALRRAGPPIAPRLLEEGTAADGRPYLVMELVRGPSLAARLAELRSRPPEERAALVEAFARSAGALHARGLVHRDLKPDNALVREGDPPSICLIDFGLARAIEPGAAPADGEPDPLAAELTAEDARPGTAAYMAPEQCEGRSAGVAADVYAMGVVLFEALVGRPPFEGSTAEVMQAHTTTLPPLPSRVAGAPPAFDAVVRRALAKAPEERFPTADDLAAALRRALEAAAAAPTAPGQTPLPPAASPRVPPVEVALLALRTAESPQVLADAAGEPGVTVARASPGFCILAFLDQPSAGAGVSAALRVASRLSARHLGAVVHSASVRVRKVAGGALLVGAEIDRAGQWAQAAAGVAVTPAALEAFAAWSAGAAHGKAARTTSSPRDPGPLPGALDAGGAARRSRPHPPSAAAIAPSGSSGEARAPATAEIERRTPPFVGQEALLGALAAEAERCRSAREPCLSVITGDPGLGKTRVLAEIAARNGHRFASIIRIQSISSREEQGGLRLLVRAAFALAGAEPGKDDVRSACLALLGDPEGEELWAAAAFAVGAIGGEDPALARMSATPGALRRAVARAIGRGLARRAAEAPLAVLIDDAHDLDPAALDALEIATLAGQDLALWVVLSGPPSLVEQRPALGERAARKSARALAPLGDEARALLAALLHPVEVLPDPVVERLLAVTGGVPLYLVELAHELWQKGRIRRYKDTGGYYLAADELMEISATPLAERLAQRALAELPSMLRDILQMACILGAEVRRAEVEAVQAAVAAEGPRMDVRVGLERLERRGLLQAASPGVFRFRHAVIQQALEALVPSSQRRRLHAAALAHLLSMPGSGPGRLGEIARHAAAVGERHLAAQAALDLAEIADSRHAHIEAESLFSQALRNMDAPEPAVLERVLTRRGQIRAFLERYDGALADLDRALSLAAERGDDAAQANLLLDLATLHDLRQDHGASADAWGRAEPIVARLFDAELTARLTAARGRTLYRQGNVLESTVELARAADMAAGVGDTRTRTEALLVLGPALIAVGRVAESGQRFEEVITLCTATGDRFHLAMAHINRLVLWIKLQDYDRALADQRVALAVARELGNATLEAYSIGNLSELLYYCGALEEALPLARRTDEMLRRQHPKLLPAPVLTLARVEAALGHAAEGRRLLAELSASLGEEPMSVYLGTMIRMIERMLEPPESDEPAEWDEILAALGPCAETDEAIDALYHAADRALRAGRLEEAARRVEELGAQACGTMWPKRREALAARLRAAQRVGMSTGDERRVVVPSPS